MSIGGRELFLYANNTGSLYRMKMAIAKNLATKKARGVYDRELAVKGWMHFANVAAKSYVKEHGSRGDKWSTTFPVVDRQYAAKEWRDWWTDQQKAGAFESLLPAKYQKASTRKGTADAFRRLGQKAGAALRRAKRAVAPKKKASVRSRLAQAEKVVAVTLPAMGNKKHYEHGNLVLVMSKGKSTRWEGPNKPVSTTHYAAWIEGRGGQLIVRKADEARTIVRKFRRTGKLEGAS